MQESLIAIILEAVNEAKGKTICILNRMSALARGSFLDKNLNLNKPK